MIFPRNELPIPFIQHRGKILENVGGYPGIAASMREYTDYKRFLGKRTRGLRKERGLTQAALAEHLGVTQEYLGKIERGLASPSFPLLLALAEALGAEPADLLHSGPGGSAPADGGSLSLREVRHRMRNGFQFLSGLVTLEMQRAEGDAVQRVLRDLAARIRCLLLVDDALDEQADGGPQDLGEKLRQVWAAVSSLYLTPRVEAEHRAEKVLVPPGTARVCGLVLTEFLTNMYKHAFPGREAGVFSLDLARSGGMVRLVLADDGVGLQPGQAAGRPSTMGLTLMRSYVEYQLQGIMRLEGRAGTTLSVEFPLSAR